MAPGTHGPLLSPPGVNLLVGTENGLMLLDRSGQGKVYNLINRRRFQQMDVLEGLNVLVTISGAPLKLSPRHLLGHKPQVIPAQTKPAQWCQREAPKGGGCGLFQNQIS